MNKWSGTRTGLKTSKKKEQKKEEETTKKQTNFKTSVVLLKITLNKIRSPPLKLLLSKM